MSLSLKSNNEFQFRKRLQFVFATIWVLPSVLAVSSGCQCPWTCTNSQLSDSHRFFQSGIEAYHEGNHQQAEKLLVQAIEARPGDPILREHLASNFLKQGEKSEAIEQLMQAADLSGKDNASNLVRIGQIYLGNGQWILAEQYANRALASNRQLPDAWILQADIKFARGQLNDSIRDYQRALSLKPNLPKIQMKVAEIHRLSGRNLRAYSTIEQMLSQLPTAQQSEEAILLAGNLLMDLQQPAQAVEKLNPLTNRAKVSPDYYLLLASAQNALGRSVEAKSTLLAAHKIYPDNQSIAKKIESTNKSNERIAALEMTSGEVIR